MKFRTLTAWFWTLVILLLCWLPKQYVPGQERLPRPLLVINFDKIVHGGIFLVFAMLWMRTSQGNRRVLWVFLGGLTLAVISELGQESTWVNRDATWGDGLADTLGVLIGIIGSLIIDWSRAKLEAIKIPSSETP